MNSHPILLVEDNENDIIFMRRMMRVAGVNYPLQVVTDGQEAIDYLAGRGNFADRGQFPLPCLVLLDLVNTVAGCDARNYRPLRTPRKRCSARRWLSFARFHR
jgi:CheY-like chemotaxis protein